MTQFQVSATTEETKELLDKGKMDELLLKDQLLALLNTEKSFRGFHEV